MDELLDPRQVVLSKLLDVVVTGPIDIVRWVLVLGGLVKFLRVVERHYLIALAMDNIYRTLDVGHAVYVRKVVDRQAPA